MTHPLLDPIRSFLAARNVEAYVVGGYVRDLLLGVDTNDLDVAVEGDALALARGFAHAIDGHFVLLDPINNIARVVSSDNRCYADISQLRDGALATDLAARDFTFNALALPLATPDKKHIIDPHNGRQDMGKRLVRAVGESTFQDDPARLVRAVRFAAQLGYSIEPRTAELMRRDAALLRLVAGERVRDEFAKILAAPGTWHHLHQLDALGLMTHILPELDALRGVSQPPQHVYDVFTHSLAVADAVEETLAACEIMSWPRRPPGPPHPALPVAVLGAVAARVRDHMAERVSADRNRLITLKLGALLHDVAKPRTRSVDEQGNIHFYNHPIEGLALAEEAMRRLRFSVREIHIVAVLIANHMRPAQLASEPQVTAKAIYNYFRDTGPEGVDTLLLSLADHLGTRGPRLNPSAWWQHAQFTRLMLERYYAQPETIVHLPKLINGNDVIALGVPSGALVGRLLEEVREAQIMGDIQTRDQALDMVRRRLGELRDISRQRAD